MIYDRQGISSQTAGGGIKGLCSQAMNWKAFRHDLAKWPSKKGLICQTRQKLKRNPGNVKNPESKRSPGVTEANSVVVLTARLFLQMVSKKVFWSVFVAC